MRRSPQFVRGGAVSESGEVRVPVPVGVADRTFDPIARSTVLAELACVQRSRFRMPGLRTKATKGLHGVYKTQAGADADKVAQSGRAID